MSMLGKLRNMNLDNDTTVMLSYSDGTDVFVHNETEVDDALEYTDVVSTFAELIATPGLKVRTRWGGEVLQSLRDEGLLDDYERDGTFEEYLATIITENFYDQEFVEYSTEKYDHKRGFTTLSVDVEASLGDLLEHATWISSNWSVSVKTDNGTLTLD